METTNLQIRVNKLFCGYNFSNYYNYKIYFFLFAFLFLAINTNILFSQVVITELMYEPSFADNEWVELFNSSSVSSAQVVGWQIKDDAGKEFTIFTLGELKPNERAVVANDTIAFKREFPNYSCKLTQPATRWNLFNNTSGDSVILLDSKGEIIDMFKYSTTWGQKSKDSGIVSLQKIDTKISSNEATNWLLRKPTPCLPSPIIKTVEQVVSNLFLVYPSPANRYITIDCGDNTHRKEIFINDLLGKTMIELNTQNNKFELDISSFLNGVYFLEIKSNGSKQITKIIKSDN